MNTIARILVAATIATVPAAASAQDTSPKSQVNDIVAVAAKAGTFNTLIAAVKAAGLVETLQGPGPFTVFAPTDEAFAKLPKGAIDALLKDKKKLAAVLTYHVIPGRVMAADVVQMGSGNPATVNGQPVHLMLRDGKVYVNRAQVITADIQASNGVIHVIDAVIMPAIPASTAGR